MTFYYFTIFEEDKESFLSLYDFSVKRIFCYNKNNARILEDISLHIKSDLLVKNDVYFRTCDECVYVKLNSENCYEVYSISLNEKFDFSNCLICSDNLFDIMVFVESFVDRTIL